MTACMRSSLLWARCRAPSVVLPRIHCRSLATRWWTDEQLATTRKYPLSKKLLKELDPRPKYALKGRGNVKTIHLRPQIVSPDLCDDIIDYYGHRLEKHKGCDILDLNPGAGLWSSKLHEFLKPRSHILLESEPELFERFLQPLVEKPGSTYKLIKGDPTEFPTFSKLIAEGVFPHQKALEPGDAQACEPNDSLVVTGSIAWDPPIPGMGFDSMSKQMFMKFTTLSWHNEIFHAFGRARMLLWFLKEDLNTIQPRGILHAGKANVTARKLADITEVVGAENSMRKAGGSIGREARYELESLTKAMQGMKEKGITLPLQRRSHIHDYAEEILKMTGGTGRLSAADCTQYLREKVQSGKPVTGLATEKAIETWKMEPDLPHAEPVEGKPRARRKPGVKGDSRLRTSMKRLETLRTSKDKAADAGSDIYELECKILGMEEGKERDAELQRLEQLQRDFDSVVEQVDRNYRLGVFTDIDDRISIRSGTARTAWDERPIEPLMMQPEEAWPPNRMSLADIQPRSTPEGQSAQALDYFIDFLYGLHAAKGSSVLGALEKLQPGASELVDQVPILKDPARGGRLNLDELRVRMLTPDMIDELCKAYHAWPFKHPEANHSGFFRARVGHKSEYTLD